MRSQLSLPHSQAQTQLKTFIQITWYISPRIAGLTNGPTAMRWHVAFGLALLLPIISAQYPTRPTDPELDACNNLMSQCGSGTNFPSDAFYCCDNNFYVRCWPSIIRFKYILYSWSCDPGYQCVDSTETGASCQQATECLMNGPHLRYLHALARS